MSSRKRLKEVFERTKNITPTSEMRVSVQVGRQLPRTGIGLSTALFAARERVRALEDALLGMGEKIHCERIQQKSHSFSEELKNCWSQIDLLEAKLQEHGLSIPDSRS